MFPTGTGTGLHAHGQDAYVLNSDEETHSVSASSASPMYTGRDGHQPLPPLPTSAPRDSLTPTPRAAAATDARTAGTVESGTNTMSAGGLGLGTPLPPPPHAQQPTPFIPSHIIEPESPTSLTGSDPAVPPPLPPSLPPAPTSAHPSLPPSPPPRGPSQHPAQAALARSNTGASASGLASGRGHRSRTNTGNTGIANAPGTGYGNVYGSGNGNGAHRTSIATSLEKAGMLLDPDAPPMSPSGRVLQVDLPSLGYGDRESRYRESRYRESGRASMPLPMPVLMPDGRRRERERGMGMGELRHRSGMGPGGGGGGGGMIGMDGESDSELIGVPRLPRTVHERLQPTIDHAMAEEAKYARKALITGYALNAAIGLQVFIGALITALSAVTSGRRTQIMTSVLGGASTVVASYLARARGSNEPELSITRTKDLQRFVRACDAFVQDHGLETGLEGFGSGSGSDGNGKESGGGGGGGGGGGWDGGVRARELDGRIRQLRNELEHLLGNGNGERKLSPPV